VAGVLRASLLAGEAADVRLGRVGDPAAGVLGADHSSTAWLLGGPVDRGVRAASLVSGSESCSRLVVVLRFSRW
jgi:hypothetical protein